MSLWLLAILCIVPQVNPAAVHADPMAPIAGACSTPLALTLHAGLPKGISHASLRPAPDIPPGPIPIKVPLYPGAVPSTLPMPHAGNSYPASRYLKAATAEYQLSTNWTKAAQWYRRAFVACGYTESGHGALAIRGVTVSKEITMADTKHSPLEVSLAFTHGPAHTTLLRYLAYTTVLPPPAILVPGRPNALRIAVHFGMNSSTPNESVVVHSPKGIAELIHHLNNLPPLQAVFSCPMDDGSHDGLRFAYPDGGRLTVDVGLRGCRIVRSGRKVVTALSDNGLYRLLDRLVPQPSVADDRGFSSSTSSRFLYNEAISRLLRQTRFELTEIVHYGARSQPERYHIRLRYIAPNCPAIPSGSVPGGIRRELGA